MKKQLATGSVLVAIALMTAAGCSSDPDDVGEGDTASASDSEALTSSPQCSRAAILARTGDGRRQRIINRAYDWIDAQVMYTQHASYQGYRRDCSGYVSMAWEREQPGPATCYMPPKVARGDIHTIPNDQLDVGDALTRVPGGCGTGGHIRLFGGWVNRGAGTFCILEEYSTGKPAHAALATTGNLSGYQALRLDDAGSGGGSCSSSQTQACGNYGCACVGGSCSGGFCAGTGCTSEETAACGNFGVNCVDHKCSGGFGAGSGCTAKETVDCGKFGTSCVDHKCSGGYTDGSGCTARESTDCGNVGCGCVDHKCGGGYCPGTGCTAKETNDCGKFGCGCAVGKCSGGACK